MDLFQQIKEREEEKIRQKESKLKAMRSKVQKKDLQFFNDDDNLDSQKEDEQIIKNRHLLNFKPQELKTVFYDEEGIQKFYNRIKNFLT